MKTSILLSLCFTALALPALAQMPSTEALLAVKKETIMRVGAAAYIDKSCKFLKPAERNIVQDGLDALKTNKDADLALSKDDLKQLNTQSQTIAGELACGEAAKMEVGKALENMQKLQKLGSAPVQEDQRFFKIYTQMKVINAKCHFYNDEMTAIFARKQEELGARIQRDAPELYTHLFKPYADELEAKKADLPADACTDDTIKQMVTMMAWKATDTFAKTLVAAPDCKAEARCDLPSKLFKP